MNNNIAKKCWKALAFLVPIAIVLQVIAIWTGDPHWVQTAVLAWCLNIPPTFILFAIWDP